MKNKTNHKQKRKLGETASTQSSPVKSVSNFSADTRIEELKKGCGKEYDNVLLTGLTKRIKICGVFGLCPTCKARLDERQKAEDEFKKKIEELKKKDGVKQIQSNLHKSFKGTFRSAMKNGYDLDTHYVIVDWVYFHKLLGELGGEDD